MICCFFFSNTPILKLEITSEPILSFPDLEIDLSNRRVICKDQEVKLTVKEYDLLCLLAANRGRVTYIRTDL